jgi:hypothetical protein
MSNTAISPGAGAISSAGIAASMALGITPLQGVLAGAGKAPSLTAANVVNPAAGLPLSWSGLGQGAVGATVGPYGWQQVRVSVSGTLGSYGQLVFYGSSDAVNWVGLGGVNDLVLPGFSLPSSGPFGGPFIDAPGNGLIVISANDVGRFAYLRPVVLGGDGSTNLNIQGTLNPGGAS